MSENLYDLCRHDPTYNGKTIFDYLREHYNPLCIEFYGVVVKSTDGRQIWLSSNDISIDVKPTFNSDDVHEVLEVTPRVFDVIIKLVAHSVPTGGIYRYQVRDDETTFAYFLNDENKFFEDNKEDYKNSNMKIGF